MISGVKKINPIYLLVTSFFLFKLIHLRVPYFWDELGVYSRAALYLFDHGISMLPDAMPPELSRGHPLLCAVFFVVPARRAGMGVYMKVPGNSLELPDKFSFFVVLPPPRGG
ncbi:MAG: hypothetical protein D3909_13730, partial [Candidatus Electrothrix sp. ATG1]|nr:hypothetical protein [Candidatus Electrothrix sp. ATG1]